MTGGQRRGALRWVVLSLFLMLRAGAGSAPLPEFAYQDFTLRVLQADGTPVAGAAVYGFCPETNLLWPRRSDVEVARNSRVWEDAFLEKTGADGSVKVTVPPGKWGFFASADKEHIVAWTDFRERHPGDTIELKPATTRRWTLACSRIESLNPTRIFVKPDSFPVWISLQLDAAGASVDLQMSAGTFGLWASGDATAAGPGFVLDFGTLSNKTADGRISANSKTVTIACQGAHGPAKLQWSRYQHYGLEGETALTDAGKVLFTPGEFTVGYERPVTGGLTGVFSGRSFTSAAGESITLNFDTPLTAALDQDLATENKRGDRKLDGRLYVTDGNGQLLSEVLDADRKPVPFSANVTVNGQHLPAPMVHVGARFPDKILQNQTVVSANVGTMQSCENVAWEFTSPPGLLPQPTLTANDASADVTVSSATFRTDVPSILAAQARDVLAQADRIASVMDQVAGHPRRHTPTQIVIHPQPGASAGHNGERMVLGSEILFAGAIFDRHPFSHELGHNYGYHHGGLMETVVEISRCYPNPMISQQPVKWMFFDRMNGHPFKEIGYTNSGLYFYFYSRGGNDFLRFMRANEYAVFQKLEKANFTEDEMTAALCSIAMKQDVGPICRAYGLNATPDRVTQAMTAARALISQPSP